MRLLYARASYAHSYKSGEKMVSYSDEEILSIILKEFENQKTIILSPVIRARKGHYRELFEQISKQGFIKVRINGEITEITSGMKLDRFKTHDIEIIIDRLVVKAENKARLKESIATAMKYGKGMLMTLSMDNNEIRFFSRMLMCPSTGIAYEKPEPNSFSFNSPKGACKKCNGLGNVYEIDLEKIIPNTNLSIKSGAIKPIEEKQSDWIIQQIENIAKRFNFELNTPISDIPKAGMDAILFGLNDSFQVSLKNAGLKKTYKIQFEGIANFIKDQFFNSSSPKLKRWAAEYMANIDCKNCNGSRIKLESRHFLIDKKNISQIAQLDIKELKKWIKNLPSILDDKQQTIANEILKELNKRVQFLLDVGLEYLTLNRTAKTLSGGESQRIRLATQIGSQLTDVLYILDEPSIGLHQRDNHKLIQSLKNLRDIGNSVIVVEHDKEMILSSDYIVDVGPGAGRHGGEIIAQGTLKDFTKSNSTTVKYLKEELSIKTPSQRRKGNGKKLILKGAKGNNLKNISVEFPLGKIICVTGVSGSGKSSLINGTLYPILNQHFFNSVKKPLQYDYIHGLENIDKVIEVNQAPIGKTPRSNPATYTGVI